MAVTALSVDALIVADLRSGLGVEDIGWRHAARFHGRKHAERHARDIVAYLRNAGLLKKSTFFAPLRWPR